MISNTSFKKDLLWISIVVGHQEAYSTVRSPTFSRKYQSVPTSSKKFQKGSKTFKKVPKRSKKFQLWVMVPKKLLARSNGTSWNFLELSLLDIYWNLLIVFTPFWTLPVVFNFTPIVKHYLWDLSYSFFFSRDEIYGTTANTVDRRGISV